jgi:hypothetical protein
MKSLIIIIIGLYASWHYTDLSSSNVLISALAPFGVFIFLVCFAIWLVLKAGFGARTDDRGYFSRGTDFGGDGGGDGGGSD